MAEISRCESYNPLPDLVFAHKVLTLDGAVYATGVTSNTVVLLRFENLEKYLLKEFSVMHTLPSFKRLQRAGIDVLVSMVDFYSDKLKMGPAEVLKTWEDVNNYS